MEKLLELRDVTKSYSGVTVLEHISVSLYAGEVLCLVGENGAGKSTMIKIISGAISPDCGEIEIDGKIYDRLQPKQAIDLGIATIYQDIDLVDNLTVADNIFLGCELHTKAGTIDSKRQEQISNDLFDELKLTGIKANQMLEELPISKKQCVQIVKALRNKARILILDEPTASLGEEETAMLLNLVKKLAADGIGIIYISHYINELFLIGTRLMVLKDGQQAAIRNTAETNTEEIIHDMIGHNANVIFSRDYFPIGEETLEFRNFSDGKHVHDVSFTVHAGEIFGIGGLVGAGRTELIRMIYGCDRRRSGKVFLNGKDITPKNPKDATRKGLFMISEDRKRDGLFTLRSVKENISVTSNEKHELLNLKRETGRVGSIVEKFNIKITDQNMQVTSLSGGNQQKTIIARCVLDPGTIYIFDEPTKGVDIGAKEEIYRHIMSLAKQNKFVIIVSSDMPELLSLSDRIGVMREGCLVDIVNARETSADELLPKYFGVESSQFHHKLEEFNNEANEN